MYKEFLTRRRSNGILLSPFLLWQSLRQVGRVIEREGISTLSNLCKLIDMEVPISPRGFVIVISGLYPVVVFGVREEVYFFRMDGFRLASVELHDIVEEFSVENKE